MIYDMKYDMICMLSVSMICMLLTHDAKGEHLYVGQPFTGVYCRAGKTCLVAGIPYMMYMT